MIVFVKLLYTECLPGFEAAAEWPLSSRVYIFTYQTDRDPIDRLRWRNRKEGGGGGGQLRALCAAEKWGSALPNPIKRSIPTSANREKHFHFPGKILDIAI
jgi:hypothetical protein